MPALAAVVDTDVFSALFITSRDAADRQRHPVEEWKGRLSGLRVVIATQTRAEVLSGAMTAGWGERRVGQVRELLGSTPTIGVDLDVVERWAQLTAEARSVGHAIGQKVHAADRWIAASAIAKDLPLLSGDGVFVGAPGLRLLP